MIVNSAHRFVFIHVPKTGGLSIVSALNGLPGNAPELCEAKTRHETLGQWTQRIGFQNPHDCGSFFKFGFVRNPWDKVASLYRYLKEHRPRPEIDTVGSFGDFLSQIADGVDWVKSLHSLRPQTNFFENKSGEIEADFIGNYEILCEDFDIVSSFLGLTPNLPHENRSSQFGRDYRGDYSDWQVDIVGEHFEKDLQTFGYEFESRKAHKRLAFLKSETR